MSDYTVHNLLSGTMDWSGSWGNASAWHADGTHGDFAVMSRGEPWYGLYNPVKLTAGHTYTFSACVKVEPGENHLANIYVSSGATVNDTFLAVSEFDNHYAKFNDVADGEWHTISHTFTVKASKYAKLRVEQTGYYKLSVCAYMLVDGTEPAAWAPAEGETLAGVGALMSANLWDVSTGTFKPDASGVYLVGKSTGGLQSAITGASALAEDQTIHMGASLRGAGKGCLKPFVEYKDAAGSLNRVGFPKWTPTGQWQRFEATCVVPSGMTPTRVGFDTSGATGDIEVLNPAFSYGSPVCLASSAHTPYATQDHISATYATKASLKVTSDAVTAEVTARAQTDRNVADLSSRLTQTANSLTSEISDRRSAITTVTGLANAAQSTADNAAKQANLYSIGRGNAGAVPKWIHLGTLTSAGDASCATISVYSGNGYNAQPSQNSKLTITIRDGSQWDGSQLTSSAVNACGVTVMRENCDDALVDVLAQSATVYDVWVYVPWKYSNGCYSVSGQYTSWQHSGATQKDEPATSDTQVKQDVAYRLADATKAQTMATENRSSIKQLSNSITSEVNARAKTDGAVSELSSKMEQTVKGINISLDSLTATEKQIHSWFDFGSDASGNPKLAMGSSSSPIVGEYSNTGATYKDRSGATLLALDAANSTTGADHVVSNDMTIGKWQWVPTNGGDNLTLVWKG